jgi:hypothetical protein
MRSSSSQGRHNRLLWSVYHLGSLPNRHLSRLVSCWIVFNEEEVREILCDLGIGESFLQLANVV